VQNGQELRRQHRYPPLRQAQGRLLQKTQGQGTLEPNFRLPFERISDPQIPLTTLKKMEQLSIFGLPNDYLITEI
jgi:hypothetical protein